MISKISNRFCKSILVLVATVVALSVPASRLALTRGQQQPFQSSEELVYEAKFSRSILRGLYIGDIRLVAERSSNEAGTMVGSSMGSSFASPAESRSPDTWRFIAEANSRGFFTRLFGIKFSYQVESFVDSDSLSAMRTLKRDEQGKRVRESEAVFDRVEGKVVWTERDPMNPNAPPTVASSDFAGIIQDVVSIIYYIRTQPLVPGKNFEISLSDSGSVFQIPVKVVGKKKQNTVLGKVSTIEVVPELFGEQRLIQQEGEAIVWLTDDNRRIPVKVKVSTNHGSVDIKLKSFSSPGRIVNRKS